MAASRAADAVPAVTVVEDAAAVVGCAVQRLAQALSAALSARARCSFALSGGSTPGPIYRALATTALPWERVDFYFTDERCVPPDAADSNYRLARDTLFDLIGARPEHVHRMEGERADPGGAAADYEVHLPRALDVVLLGIGEDGHTASLFPASPALEERVRRVLAVSAPSGPSRRITLTLPALQSARSVLGVASGSTKRRAVGDLRAGRCPAGHIPRAHWIVDRLAAGAV